MCAQDVDPGFVPQLVSVELSSREVRPGDDFALTLHFRNAGALPARREHWVFVHFEAPAPACQDIRFQADHAPDIPTTMWQPGESVTDGPRLVTAPADKGEREYFIHVGLYDIHGSGGRLLDTYDAGTLRVTKLAPALEDVAPAPLSAAELQSRRSALAARVPADRRASLETDTWRFDLDRASGAWALTDKRTGALWCSDPSRPRFGTLTLRKGERLVLWSIDRFEEIVPAPDRLRMVTRPVCDGAEVGLSAAFSVVPVSDPPGLRLAWETQGASDWQVVGVSPLQDALWVTESEEGCVYVPHRLGIELPAATGVPGRQEWVTYDGLSMAMCGAVKQGSALLVNWEHVDTRLQVRTLWPDLPIVPGRRMRAVSLEVAAPDGACTIHPLGPGGYVEIAHAYRTLARAKGWLRTWADKRTQFRTVDRLFGAANFKPFVLSRVMPSSRFSDGTERVFVGFTFDEVAQCAEHWRNDLGIDRAFVVMAGWINGGYDVRHPDILPAAPECGGNEGLKRACERIKACGYLVGLHDNYQDMYQDAPSWSEDWLNKDSAGRPKMGGNWNGGQAWQVCAIKQVELAAREDSNLPRVAALFAPTIYFIDTTFAWGLVTCEDPRHPMTRQDDLEWKTKLCMLAKRHFGLFGSEEGREWSVPCADYLEGIFSHQTNSGPGSVIPLFPLVYSDCVQIMTHQGDRIGLADEKKMADHILFAEMPLPSFGNHLYFREPTQPAALPLVPLPPTVKDLGGRRFEITYHWRADARLDRDYRIFVHFTHPAATRAESIAYQNDHMPTLPTSQWQPGVVVDDGPFVVEVPDEFDGASDILLGMTDNGQRVRFANLRHSGLRYEVGTVEVSDQGIRFVPSEVQPTTEIWSRADGGWGESLCPTDRVIKNAWEVLSPLNVITAETPLTSHEFVSEDRLLQRTRFGDVTITVSYEKPAQIGDNVIPPYGFIVESPTFIAFCATRYNGIDYPEGALFTARSLDGKPITQSGRVRIYHGFGDRRIRLGGRVYEVAREGIVEVGAARAG